MNKTYEIKREALGELEVLAEGYKAVEYDNSTKQNFRYGEKGESLVGKIFKVDGDISECKWGLHFSKDPANVFNFYEPLGYNKYFKVRAYGTVIDSDDGLKSVTQIIEFVEEYDMMEYIKLIKRYDRSAVRDSTAVRSSNAVRSSTAVGDSNAVSDSNAVGFSYGLVGCEAVKRAIFCSDIECQKNVIFNTSVSEKRFDEVYRKIRSFNYFPRFDNFYDLKGDKEWWTIAFPELMSVDTKTAWSKMPADMREYIQSLPEYDEAIFRAITEGAKQ